MTRAGALALVGALAACGGKGGAGPDGAAGADGPSGDGPEVGADGGVADLASGEALPAGFRAYDVTATVTLASMSGGADFATFPTTFLFTFAWNPATGAAYTGADGAFGAVRVVTKDDRTFRSVGWRAGAPFAMSCTGWGDVSFDEVTFSFEGAALRGTASGAATYATNAGVFSGAATAVLVGAPDVTPPTFTSPGAAVDPLAPIVLAASEPLPLGASASLVGAPSGDVLPLDGVAIDDPETSLDGFATTDRVLRYGETYTLVTDHVADYAGNAPAAPVTFTTRAAPPLVPEDGFESVTGTMFAGAGVLRGGPLMPLAGATSLLLNTGYGGGFGFLPYDLGSSLAVRLAVAPGATVIRFDSQLIAPDPIDAASFVGEIRFGSVGGTVVVSRDVGGVGFVKETLPQLGDIYVSPEKTIDLPLPADATSEITFEIVGEIDLCMQPPSPTVLVVDNLRVE
jgi:hypothetical protein